MNDITDRPLPQILFKYCSYDGLKLVLKNKTFRANPPTSENDPTERIPAGLDHAGLVNFVKTSPALRSSIATTLLSLGLSTDNVSTDAVVERIGPDVTSGIEKARTPDGWRRIIANRAAFVSFSECDKSEYMWREYSDIHRGARLSFSSNRLQELHCVPYANSRVSPNPGLPLMSYELRVNILAWLTTKERNGKWDQEYEWRRIVKWKETKKQKDSQGRPFIQTPFDPEAMLEVQLGNACPQDAEEKIMPFMNGFANAKLTRERAP